MDATIINRWIKSLGRTYDELVTKGIIPDIPLQELYAGRDWLHIEPGAGLELDFGAENKHLAKLHIILIQVVENQTIYSGELPAPFSLKMDKAGVRALLGNPISSKGTVKLPGGLGMRGGWDVYRLQEEINPDAKVWFNYTADLMVYSIVFTLGEE